MTAETDRTILQAALDLANAQSAAYRSALCACVTSVGAPAWQSQANCMRRLLAINEIVEGAIK